MSMLYAYLVGLVVASAVIAWIDRGLKPEDRLDPLSAGVVAVCWPIAATFCAFALIGLVGRGVVWLAAKLHVS